MAIIADLTAQRFWPAYNGKNPVKEKDTVETVPFLTFFKPVVAI